LREKTATAATCKLIEAQNLPLHASDAGAGIAKSRQAPLQPSSAPAVGGAGTRLSGQSA